MTDFKEKIGQIREQEGLSRRAFGELLGVAESKIQKIEIGAQRADHEFLSILSQSLAIDMNWLLGETSKPPLNADTTNEFINVPRLAVEASAGNGTAVESESETHSYAFSRKWLTKRGLAPNHLSVISVRGDSMEPDLNDGDLILIDRADTTLADGKIYAVQYSNNLFVKRIQYIPGDTVRLGSSNALYSPIEITTPEADGVHVVGRVVASMHEW